MKKELNPPPELHQKPLFENAISLLLGAAVGVMMHSRKKWPEKRKVAHELAEAAKFLKKEQEKRVGSKKGVKTCQK